MTEDRWARVRDLFDRAADLPAAERRAFLDAACPDAPDVREEIEGLLAYDTGPAEPGAAGFLNSPLVRPSGDTPPGPTEPDLPSHIGRYRVLRLLGQGGMGTVYLAEQSSPRRAVALKVIRTGFVSLDLVKRFTREAEILGRLQHPGIAQVYETGMDSDWRPFFAMEFIRGEPLDQYARRHGLGTAARLAVVARVADAVQHAHDKGVVHRDLKPGNILVDETGQPKVLDFGVARATDADVPTTTGRTETGQLIGTLDYMSPEQMAADPALVDGRSDVYALGVILYALLADRLPHDLTGLPLPEVARVVRDQDPSSLGAVDPRLRGDVETIVAKALEKDRARRYPSAAELAADIRRSLNDEPIRARPSSVGYRLRKFARRHKALVGGVAAVVAALVLGLIGTLGFALREADQRHRAEAKTEDEVLARNQAEQNRNQAEQNRRAARRNLYTANIRLAQQAWVRGQTYVMEDILTEAAQGQPGDEDLRGFEWHFLWRKAHPTVRTLRGHADRVVAVAFGADGRFLVSASTDGTARVWEAAGGEPARTLNPRPGQVPPQALTCVCVSPDGRRVACDAGGDIVIWDAATGRELLRWGAASGVTKLAFSPDGERVVSAGFDGTVRAWEAATGRALFRTQAHQGVVRSVAFRPDGKWLVSTGHDGLVRLWHAADGKFLRVISGHVGMVTDAAFSPDGQLLATAGVDGTVRVWEAASAKPVLTFTGHRDKVWSVAFSPDGTQAASAGDDRTVRVWDVAKGAERALLAHNVEVAGVAFSPDGRRLASADADNSVRVWELTSPNDPAPLKGHSRLVLGVAFSPDGQRLASGGLDRTVCLWDAAGGKKIATLSDHPGTVRGVAFSPAGGLLASAGDDERIRLWDAADGRPVRTLRGHAADQTYGVRVYGVAFSPRGERLASAGHDGTVRIWDVSDGREVFALRGHTGAVNGVAFSSDGRRVASAGADGTVRVWDATGGQPLLTLTGHAYAVNSVSFAPGGHQLASASDDSTIRLWDAEEGREVRVLHGHTGQVRCVAFSPDGARLASAGLDRTVCLWDAAAGKQLLALPGSTEELFGLAFRPDGMRLALVGRDPVVRLW